GGIERLRLAGGDVAEGAGAGADLTHDHHRGVALRPAFADVRTGRLLADGHQAVGLHDVAGGVVAGGARRTDAQPLGLAQQRRLRVRLLFRVAGTDRPAEVVDDHGHGP